jgi:anthranilate synthase
MNVTRYRTQGGIEVARERLPRAYGAGLPAFAAALDERRGLLLSSSFEFPGRYTRWDMAFVDPPLQLTARGRSFAVEALNRRGCVPLGAIERALAPLAGCTIHRASEHRVVGEIAQPTVRFAEEARSRQPTIFSVLREVIALFHSPEDPHLGLYGAFGYDLVFQFEPMPLRLPRQHDQRDLVLYLPDEIITVDHMKQEATTHRYDFTWNGQTTAGESRTTDAAPNSNSQSSADTSVISDHKAGEYAALVERARTAFKRGDLFEVVLGQLFQRHCHDNPSTVFERLRRVNPAPYGALINLGEGEFLVAASPEMFVRVEGRRVETCPISGTIARGRDALEDAEQIRELLNSAKDEAELTMCTDVDRNDKSRICEAGSVRVIGRRQIELYSRLIHTVDHVEGTLREEFDALDAFLTHAWAVTVTGAPKRWAIRFIEEEERSARRWYGGAIGRVTFDGNMNTGLTLRTIRLKDGVAEVRAGATLLYDSDPASEDAECHLKAAAMFAAIEGAAAPRADTVSSSIAVPQIGAKILLIDHEDSFVHTLAGYCRSLGAEVTTMRPELARAELSRGARPDLALLSPGPGRPADFAMAETLDLLVKRGLPVFGVCLGLQGIVEYFGGALDLLDTPMHGKTSEIRVIGGRLLRGLPERFTAGRYHSLHARRSTLPADLCVTAETADGIIMALEHRRLPMAAVQFHPESVMTAAPMIGLPIIAAALTSLRTG